MTYFSDFEKFSLLKKSRIREGDSSGKEVIEDYDVRKINSKEDNNKGDYSLTKTAWTIPS